MQPNSFFLSLFCIPAVHINKLGASRILCVFFFDLKANLLHLFYSETRFDNFYWQNYILVKVAKNSTKANDLLVELRNFAFSLKIFCASNSFSVLSMEKYFNLYLRLNSTVKSSLSLSWTMGEGNDICVCFCTSSVRNKFRMLNKPSGWQKVLILSACKRMSVNGENSRQKYH